MEVMLLLRWGQLWLSSCSMTKERARTNIVALAVAEGLQRQERTCSKADSARLSWATAV